MRIRTVGHRLYLFSGLGGHCEALHAQDFAPRYFAETVGPVEASFVQALGPLANGIISSTGWWFNFKTPGNAEFVANYKAMFHEEPDYHAAVGYGATRIFLGAAVKATQSLDENKIRNWLLQNTVDTVAGTFKVNPNWAGAAVCAGDGADPKRSAQAHHAPGLGGSEAARTLYRAMIASSEPLYESCVVTGSPGIAASAVLAN